MNILFLSELFYPHGGGAELATFLYAKLLSEAGFNIAVVTNRFVAESEVSKNENLIIYRLNLVKDNGIGKYSILQRFDVLFSSFMRKMVKWADVVYVPRYWYSAIPLAKAYGKPVVLHLHDYIPICPTAGLYDASKDVACNPKILSCSPRCIYAHERNQDRTFAETVISTALNSTIGRSLGILVGLSNAVICVSNAQKKLITKNFPSLSKKIQVIYNPSPELSYTEIEGDDFGYLGGPSYPKGFHILCRALARVKDKRIRVHATSFSEPTRQLVEPIDQLMLLYERLTGGPLEKFWRQICTLIVPSICHEPLPYVVTEALARGRVVIASSIGGIPEQIHGCKGAFLFRAGDHDQLAEAIDAVRKLSRETIVDLGFQNREFFLKRFDNTTSIERFTSICERLT